MRKANQFLDRFVVQSAPQRSGTTALQSLLKLAPGVESFFEIFHSEQFNVRSNFFFFLSSHSWAQRLYIAPTAANMEKLFLRYMRYISGMTDAKYIIIDIKDNSMHNLDCVWQEPQGAPFLLRLIRKYKIPVVRIRRRNVFLQVLSTAMATQHKKYHFKVGEEVPDDSVKLEPDALRHAMASRLASNERIQGFLRDYDRCYRIDYEDIFVDNKLSSAAIQTLNAVFDFPLGELESPLQKINTNPGGRLQNSGEILEYFKNTEYAAMVEEALSASEVAPQ